MTVPATLSAPRRNLTDAGLTSRVSTIAAADIIVALGDYTGGASEDMFTLSAHGLTSGDILYCIGEAGKGVVTGGAGTRFIVLVASSSVFQLTSDGTTVIDNTVDGVGYFLKGNGIPQRVADAVAARTIVGGNDFTGGTVEDMNFAQALQGLEDTDTIKLLYKSAAGAAGVAADATAYAKSVVATTSATASTSYFQTSLTSGGAVIDTTADGTNLWLKTS